MIIPRYWAEGVVRHRGEGRQVTVRRFGWSDVDPGEAQAVADSRAAEALGRILSGEKLAKREPKVPYNGADGVPIREEIVSENGDVVITRNSYGALCLNTPDVLFADVDEEAVISPGIGCAYLLGLAVACIGLGWGTGSPALGVWGLLVGLVGGALAAWSRIRYADPLKRLKGRIERFLADRPDWRIRVYRTPAGFRLLAMHRVFSPDDPEVAGLFAAVRADPVYVRMCKRQQCFRARISPKPWRAGMKEHIRPRPGVWPVREEWMPVRLAWIREYEQKAAGYASCRLECELGLGLTDSKARRVQGLHDGLCRAGSGLPLA